MILVSLQLGERRMDGNVNEGRREISRDIIILDGVKSLPLRLPCESVNPARILRRLLNIPFGRHDVSRLWLRPRRRRSTV